MRNQKRSRPSLFALAADYVGLNFGRKPSPTAVSTENSSTSVKKPPFSASLTQGGVSQQRSERLEPRSAAARGVESSVIAPSTAKLMGTTLIEGISTLD